MKSPISGVFTLAASLVFGAAAYAQNNAVERSHDLKSNSWPVYGHRISVNCDKRQTIARALNKARRGTTIEVSGICYEQVEINKDFIRLHGKRGAVIDGSGELKLPGTITVRGARGIVLKNLLVRNGPDQGIVIEANASVRIENIETTGNATVGVTVDSSYVELSNVKANENGAGYDFFTGATVIAQGDIIASNNQGTGLSVNGNATLELRGAIVEATNNGADGVLLVNNANLMILSFPEAQGSGLRIRNNGAAGLFVANSNIAVVGSQYAGSGANFFDISGHSRGPGMLLISSNLAVPFATAKFNLSGNGAGMVLADNTDVIVAGGLNISGNQGPGIVGDGAGLIRLQQNEANPSVITANEGPDIVMTFGSRLALDEGIANVVVCDPTVLTPSGGC